MPVRVLQRRGDDTSFTAGGFSKARPARTAVGTAVGGGRILVAYGGFAILDRGSLCRVALAVAGYPGLRRDASTRLCSFARPRARLCVGVLAKCGMERSG